MHKAKSNKFFFSLIVGLLIIGAWNWGSGDKEGATPKKENKSRLTQIFEANTLLPASVDLPVPFTPQAPFANWDHTHEEACEEASFYMAHRFYEGDPEGLMDPEKVEADLLKIIEAETKMFGYFEDTNAAEIEKFLESYYGYEVDILTNPTIEQIKRILAAGYPVLAPNYGYALYNPYYTSQTEYHMITIRGYNERGFITNDPGTKRGEGWVYDFNEILNAIRDWKPGDMQNSPHVVLVMFPN